MAGIRTEPFTGKEICMKGDTYICSGNLYSTGDIKVHLIKQMDPTRKIK